MTKPFELEDPPKDALQGPTVSGSLRTRNPSKSASEIKKMTQNGIFEAVLRAPKRHFEWVPISKNDHRVSFPSIKCYWGVVWPRFCLLCIPEIVRNMLDTDDMGRWPIENVLTQFEVGHEKSKNTTFFKQSNTPWEGRVYKLLEKSSIFGLFISNFKLC